MRADARRSLAAVLAAAEEIFSEEGLSAPVDEVARRAGVGVGTVYRHFPTKEALFEAVVKARIEAIVKRAEELSKQGDAAKALFTYISELVQAAVSKKDLVDELERWGVGAKAEIHAQLKERLFAAGETLLRRAQSAGVVRADLTHDDLTAMMMGTCEGACCPLIDPKRRAQIAARMVDVLCAGLRAGAAMKTMRASKAAKQAEATGAGSSGAPRGRTAKAAKAAEAARSPRT
jgi:AcrR family transcriptional regulator